MHSRQRVGRGEKTIYLFSKYERPSSNMASTSVDTEALAGYEPNERKEQGSKEAMYNKNRKMGDG